MKNCKSLKKASAHNELRKEEIELINISFYSS